MHTANEVLLLLQEELEGIGSSLDVFGPDVENRVQNISKVILEEMFSTDMQRKISSRKCQQLNNDQQDYDQEQL